jgi:hypothetical protein
MYSTVIKMIHNLVIYFVGELKLQQSGVDLNIVFFWILLYEVVPDPVTVLPLTRPIKKMTNSGSAYNRAAAKLMFSNLFRVSDPDPYPYWIRIQSDHWIRIRNLNTDPDPDPGGQK